MNAARSRSRNIKLSKNRLRKAREITQACADLLVRDRMSIAERYVRSDCQLVAMPLGGTTNYGAVFQRVAGVIEDFQFGVSTPPISPDAPAAMAHLNKGAMFAGNVHLMEGVEKVVPSLVWLQPFNNGLFADGERLYEFVAFVSPGGKLGGTFEDGKIDFINAHHRYAVSCVERGREQIEAATEAVNYCPNFSVEDEWKRATDSDFKDFLAGLTIYIAENDIWGTIDPLRYPSNQGIGLGFGPIDCGFSV